MAIQEAAPNEAPRTSFINDPAVRGVLYQVLVGVLVAAFISWVVFNTAQNLASQNKTTGFDFLWQTAGFNVSFSLIDFGRGSYYWQALLTGILSTLLVSFIAIIISSVVGFLLGIARLSSNWIVARLATVYVEVVRNVPLLLQLFIWYFAVLKAMPAVKQSHVLFDSIFVNQRGLYVPRLVTDDRFIVVLLALVGSVAASIAIRIWARRRLDATGQRFPVLLTSLGLIVLLPGLAMVLSGTVISFDMPRLQGFNYRGGIELPPEFVALAVGLSVYHAAFIAETVRAGIVAISHGQTEAAQSLGLRDADRLRLVIIPQAMRVIIPPLTSQYLNATKNSSLGAAIGFPEFVSIFMGTTLNQTGKAIEVVSITMLVYLIISLSTSALMNWYNSRVALVER